jgi:hypothetical protein
MKSAAVVNFASESGMERLCLQSVIAFASVIAAKYFVPLYRKGNSPSAVTFILFAISVLFLIGTALFAYYDSAATPIDLQDVNKSDPVFSLFLSLTHSPQG